MMLAEKALLGGELTAKERKFLDRQVMLDPEIQDKVTQLEDAVREQAARIERDKKLAETSQMGDSGGGIRDTDMAQESGGGPRGGDDGPMDPIDPGMRDPASDAGQPGRLPRGP